MRSLQRHVIQTTGAVLLVCALLAGVGGYRSAVTEANEALDNQLAQLAQTILFLTDSDQEQDSGDIGLGHQPKHGGIVFQVWKLKSNNDTFIIPGRIFIHRESDRPYPQLILRSGSIDSRLMLDRGEGFSTAQWAGHTFRIYAQTSTNGELKAVVGQDMVDRNEIIDDIAWSNARPYLFVIPFGIIALAWSTHRGLSPLRRITEEVSSRAPNNLEHFSIAEAPLELQPLIGGLNLMLDRLNSGIELERRFTGDAAHELRNPIAALRAQLDAMRLATTPETRIQAERNASASAERLARLINQLLTLARLDANSGIPTTSFDLAELAREACSDIAPQAVAKQIDLSLQAQPTEMAGTIDAFRILMRNLLENAVRYTPSGGQIEVLVAKGKDEILLSVADNGPGVPGTEIALLGRRFHRLSQSDPAGVGLGLSIVLRIAEHCRGRVSFGSGLDGKGLRVTITVPSAAAPKKEPPRLV
ncbi:MAG TPA: ATP-binding protein [Parasulfuritortus sp.]